MALRKIAFVAADSASARRARTKLAGRYGSVDPSRADMIVALGGDGFMLETLHSHMERRIPTYGMNRGSIGFLMNDYAEGDLPARLRHAEEVRLHPLVMTAVTKDGRKHRARAINEVSLLRQSYQAAKLRVMVDGRERLAELIADGILVATPAGSTAYNLSVNGPILPLNAPLVAMTPISAFRPRRWPGALLPDSSTITIEVLEADKRPVAATADHFEVKDVITIDIAMDHATGLALLHDPGRSLDERILGEQFGY